MKREKKMKFETKIKPVDELNQEDMKMIVGSGNSQVRYMSDEYMQVRILREGGSHIRV